MMRSILRTLARAGKNAAGLPLTLSRLIQVQSGQHADLLGVDGADAGGRCRIVDAHVMPLNAPQLRKRPFWTEIALGQFQALAHHATDDQRNEAQHRVGSDPIRQSVGHRCDFYIGLRVCP